MTTSTVVTIVSGVITDIGSVLTSILPVVFGFIALLIALFWAVRYILGRLRNAG